MKRGYIKMLREDLEDELFGLKKPLSYFEAKYWLVANCEWQGELRGSVKVSIRTLADEFGWTKSKVETFLKKLRIGQWLRQESDRIWVINFDTYQGRSDTPSDTPSDKTETTLLIKKNKKKEEGIPPLPPKGKVKASLSLEEVMSFRELSTWTISGRQAVVDWYEYRKQRRLPTAPMTWKKLFEEFEGREEAFAAAVAHTIKKGWQGLQEPRQGELFQGASGKYKTKAEREYEHQMEIFGEYLYGRKTDC